MEPDIKSVLLKHATDGLGWVCRMSTAGRGIRLCQTTTEIGDREFGHRVMNSPQDAVEWFYNNQPVEGTPS